LILLRSTCNLVTSRYTNCSIWCQDQELVKHRDKVPVSCINLFYMRDEGQTPPLLAVIPLCKWESTQYIMCLTRYYQSQPAIAEGSEVTRNSNTSECVLAIRRWLCRVADPQKEKTTKTYCWASSVRNKWLLCCYYNEGSSFAMSNHTQMLPSGERKLKQ
jgi:hypothetical protein